MNFLDMQNDILSTLNGLPRALVKNSLIRSYNELTRKWPWVFLEQTFKLDTVASYSSTSSITIAATVDSTAITGTGTTFTATMVGRPIRLAGETQFYKIAGYTSATAITLDKKYVGSDNLSEASFSIFKHIYPLNFSLKELMGITYNQPLSEVTQEYLNSIDPSRSASGTPINYSLYGKDDSGTLQVELHPHPTSPLLLSYYGIVLPDKLTSNNDEPLISGDVIVNRARVDLAYILMRIHPEDAPLIKASIQDWKERRSEGEADLISEDNRIRSARESSRDAYATNSGLGEPFWLDRNSL